MTDLDGTMQVQKPRTARPAYSWHMKDVMHVSCVNQPGMLWLDSGCNRNTGGRESHRLWQLFLACYGLQPIPQKRVEEFVFGNKQIEYSTGSFVYPCCFQQARFALGTDIAHIKPDCPMLGSSGFARLPILSVLALMIHSLKRSLESPCSTLGH